VYHTIYDFNVSEKLTWEHLPGGLMFIAVTIVVLLKDPKSNLIRFLLVFVTLHTIMYAIQNYKAYTDAKNALAQGKCKVIEGAVDYFDPMPYGGHKNEKICIKSDCFEYSDYGEGYSFNNTESHGGPFLYMKKVRIHAYNARILKLEINEE
jgi:hypothetical protein